MKGSIKGYRREEISINKGKGRSTGKDRDSTDKYVHKYEQSRKWKCRDRRQERQEENNVEKDKEEESRRIRRKKRWKIQRRRKDNRGLWERKRL